MLGTLLNTLQTTLLGSRGFLLTSVLPVLLFSGGSLWFDVDLHPEHRVWLDKVASDKPGTAALAALVALFAVSIVFSSLNTLLRELLEGKIYDLWPLSLGRDQALLRQFKASEAARTAFDRLQRDYRTVTRANWIDLLRSARKKGSTGPAPPDKVVSLVKRHVDALAVRRSALQDFDLQTLRRAIAVTHRVLESYSADDKTNPRSQSLSLLHVDLVQSIRYWQSRLQTRRLKAYWEVAAYPEALAPTRLGNIAGTLRSFAESRYGLAVDIFWTRLQWVIQSDDKMFSTIQDAKIQLDFFVSLTWLTGLFTFIWTATLLARSTNVALFLSLAIIGPPLVLIWYSLACRTYVVFADAMRGAVDVLRFKLIEAYHLPLPATAGDERLLWQELASWVGYDSPAADSIFKHKP